MSATIFDGTIVKALKPNLSLNDVIKFLTGTIDPTSVATAANPGSLYHNTVTGDVYRKIDSGSTTNWQKLASGSNAGVNYVTNPDFESNANDWNAFKESDSVTFTDAGDLVGLAAHGLDNGNQISFTSIVTTTGISVDTKYFVVNKTTNNFQVASTFGGSPLALTTDGTGTLVRSMPKTGATAGSPGITFARTTSSPLRGSGSGLLTKDAVNRMGEGVNTPLTIALSDRYKQLNVQFNYDVSANFGAGSDSLLGDMTWWIYDITNSRLQQITPYKMAGGSVGGPHRFNAHFQSSDSLSYRLIGIISQVNTSAWTAKFDDVTVGPELVVLGAPITDWQSYTPTFNNLGTVTGIEAWYRRVGGNLELRGKFTSGTGAAALASMTLPSGLVADIALLSTTSNLILGSNTTSVNGPYTLSVLSPIVESNLLYFGIGVAGGASGSPRNGDTMSTETDTFFASIPIKGWSSSLALTNDYDGRVVAARVAASGAQSIPTATQTKVAFDTKYFDTHSAFDLGTDVFVAPVAGYYQVHATVEFNLSATGQRAISLAKNGNIVAEIGNDVTPSGAIPTRINGSDVVYCNAGDTLEIQAFQSSGGNLDINGDGVDYGHLAIERIGGNALVTAGDLVAGRVFLAAATSSIPNGTQTSFPFDTKDFDTHGAYNISSNVFTVPVAGKYHFHATQRYTGSAGGERLISLEINGSGSLFEIGWSPGSGGVTRCNGSLLKDLKAGDTLKVYTFQSSGGALNLEGDSLGLYDWFEWFKVK